MKDRFDLEDEIVQIHNFADILRMLSGDLLDGNMYSGCDPERVANALIGMAEILDMQSDKLLDTMCQCFKLDQYRGTEA